MKLVDVVLPSERFRRLRRVAVPLVTCAGEGEDIRVVPASALPDPTQTDPTRPKPALQHPPRPWQRASDRRRLPRPRASAAPGSEGGSEGTGGRRR